MVAQLHLRGVRIVTNGLQALMSIGQVEDSARTADVGCERSRRMTTYDLAVALAKRWEEEGYTYEDLLQTCEEAVAEARQEIARMKGADNE